MYFISILYTSKYILCIKIYIYIYYIYFIPICFHTKFIYNVYLYVKHVFIFWPCDAKSQLIGKYPDARKDWRQKEKGTAEDEIVGWHHWFNGHKFEQTLGDSAGQKSLACCSPWGHKESDRTLQLNNNNFKIWIWRKNRTYYYQ